MKKAIVVVFALWLAMGVTPSKDLSTVTGIVVARQPSKCVYTSDERGCREAFIVFQQHIDAPRFVIVNRTYESVWIPDSALEKQITSFAVVEGGDCKKPVTFRSVGYACGSAGCSKMYDWRVLDGPFPKPNEGSVLPCYRLAGEIRDSVGRRLGP